MAGSRLFEARTRLASTAYVATVLPSRMRESREPGRREVLVEPSGPPTSVFAWTVQPAGSAAWIRAAAVSRTSASLLGSLPYPSEGKVRLR